VTDLRITARFANCMSRDGWPPCYLIFCCNARLALARVLRQLPFFRQAAGSRVWLRRSFCRCSRFACVLPHFHCSGRFGLHTDWEQYMGVSFVRLSDLGLRNAVRLFPGGEGCHFITNSKWFWSHPPLFCMSSLSCSNTTAVLRG